MSLKGGDLFWSTLTSEASATNGSFEPPGIQEKIGMKKKQSGFKHPTEWGENLEVKADPYDGRDATERMKINDGLNEERCCCTIA